MHSAFVFVLVTLFAPAGVGPLTRQPANSVPGSKLHVWVRIKAGADNGGLGRKLVRRPDLYVY